MKQRVLCMILCILVLMSTVSAFAATKNDFSYSGSSYDAVVKYGVNFRDKDGDLIDYLGKNTRLHVLGTSKDESDRVVIEYDGIIGTVLKSGVKKVSSSTQSSSSSSSSSSNSGLEYSGSSYYGKVRKYLNVRDGKYKLIGEIHKDEVVKVLGTSKSYSDRVVIEWNGKKGTVLKSGLKKVSSSSSSSSSSSNSTSYNSLTYSGKSYYAAIRYNLNMRNVKGELVGVVPAHSMVYVKGTYTKDKSRLVISYNGKVVTVDEDGVKSITDAIFVNISSQKVTLIKDGKIVAESKCVTGTKGKKDTPRGSFKITEKHKNKVFQPSGKKSDYWLRFYMGCGFHDAKWRSSFGGSIYKSNGSNGCVNLPHKFAKTLYDNSYKGMRVYVS